MKLIVALAASAYGFTGPAARLPAVARTTQLKTEQPSMLLSGVRARAQALVAPKAEAAAGAEKKGMLAGLDVPLLAYFFFWYLGNFYCARPRPRRALMPSKRLITWRRPRRWSLFRF